MAAGKRTKKLSEDVRVRSCRPEDAFASALDTEEGITLVGFLGDSPKKNHWRVYLTPELDEYYEVREKDIAEQTAVKDKAFSCSEIRLCPGVKAVHVVTEVVDLQSRYLSGELSDALLQMADCQTLRNMAPPRLAKRQARQSADEWLCTWWGGCTDGKFNGRGCTDRFGPEGQTNQTKFHLTKDLKC